MNQHSNSELLRKYYSDLYPSGIIVEWLGQGGKKIQGVPSITLREFSYEFIDRATGDTIHYRFQSYENKDQLKSYLVSKNPKRIDIGPMYNFNPKTKKENAKSFSPLQRELVFDIDMNDYDDVRTCCKDENICCKCWGLISCAIKIIQKILEDEFDFKKIMWFFSGRRGVHCWVSDQIAMELSDDARKFYANHVSRFSNDKVFAKQLFLHRAPILEEIFEEIISPYFKNNLIKEQDIFNTPEKTDKILSKFFDYKIKSEALESFKSNKEATSEEKWNILESIVNRSRISESKITLESLMIERIFPRIDYNVSAKKNHLLKSPFSIHPGTGLVCNLIDPKDCDEFIGNRYISLEGLLGKEQNEYQKKRFEVMCQQFSDRVSAFNKA